MILDEFVAKLGFIYSGGGDANRFKQELDSIDRAAQGAAAGLSKVGLAISGALAGFAIGNKVGDFIADITQAGRTAENFKTQLTTAFSGDSAAADGAFAWIEKFADISPEGVNEVTAAFIKLKAYGLDPTTGILQSIGDAAAGMGKSTDQGVEAMADAVTGEFERLKEFAGIKAKQSGDAVTFAWSESGKEQKLTVKKNSEEIQKALMGIMDKRFTGAMERKSKTWDGIVAKIQDRWQRFLKSIGDSGYYEAAKGRLQQFSDIFEDMEKDGTLGNAARGISRALVAAMNTTAHLATQAYRVGRGFYMAAEGVTALVAKMTGLSKGMAGLGMGAGLIASTALGRSAMMAIARRVPMVAAFLVLDDLMSGLAGDESVIGSLEGGEAALERIRKSFAEIHAAAEGLAGSINKAFNISAFDGEGQMDALVRSVKEFASTEVVRFLNEFADHYQRLAGIIRSISDVIADPKAAFKSFADAAIEQIDRIIAEIDEKLGGALTRFGLIGAPAVAQAAPKAAITATGRTTRAPGGRNTFTSMGALEQDGRVNAEGIGAQYKIDPERLANGANAVAKFLLDLTSFNPQAENAKLMLKSLEGTFTAKVDVNTDAAMAKINALKAEINGLSVGDLGRRRHGYGTPGEAAFPTRAVVAQSPGSR